MLCTIRHMTVGTMIELLGSKAGSCCTKFHYGSAFGERSGHADNVEAIGYKMLLTFKNSIFSYLQMSAFHSFFSCFTNIFISETLVKHGFSYDGKDFLYSGISIVHFYLSERTSMYCVLES